MPESSRNAFCYSKGRPLQTSVLRKRTRDINRSDVCDVGEFVRTVCGKLYSACIGQRVR